MIITVLMSTYNGEKYIHQQIESILNQKTSHKINIIIRDDGSKDATKEILEKYHSEGKISYYSGNNIGPQRSFYELMIKSPKSDFYAFADQDDYWFEDKVERSIKYLENIIDQPAVYYSNAMLVNENLESLDSVVYYKEKSTDFFTLSVSGGLLGCTMVFNDILMEIIRKNQIFPCMVMHDFYVALICKCFDGTIIYDNKCSIKYRQHADNVVGVNRTKNNRIMSVYLDIIKEYEYSIADQSRSIIEKYNIDDEKKQWLIKISNYRTNMVNRLSLSLSSKTSYNSFVFSIKNRLSIILGKR